jgi:hypothetical protein
VAVLSKIRMAIVAVLIAGLVVAGFVGYRLFTEEPDREPPSSRVTGTTDDGWQEVTYRGVTVEVPPDWQRLDTAICDNPLERWATVGQEQCEGDVGLSFLDSDSFDATTGPGVHTAPASDTLPTGGWTGYVTRGDLVVNVTGADEVVVRRILQSASQTI